MLLVMAEIMLENVPLTLERRLLRMPENVLRIAPSAEAIKDWAAPMVFCIVLWTAIKAVETVP